MKKKTFTRTVCFSIIACLALYAQVNPSRAQAGALGNMPADRILFLGNSITLHGPYNDWNENAHWGMAASEEAKDYVHLLTSRLETETGESIYLPTAEIPAVWAPEDGLPDYTGNILNMYYIFERTYSTWDNARIQNQLNAKPDIVVIQFGENVIKPNYDELAIALNSLLTGLKNSSDPNIFITSSILNTDATLDEIKRSACAADPSKRVFVDLNGMVNRSGVAGHPDDSGMQVIADTLYDAMVDHSKTISVPEPSTTVMMLVGGIVSLLLGAGSILKLVKQRNGVTPP